MPLILDIPSEIRDNFLPPHILDAIDISCRRHSEFHQDCTTDFVEFAPRASPSHQTWLHIQTNTTAPAEFGRSEIQGQRNCINCDSPVISGMYIKSPVCEHIWHSSCFEQSIYRSPESNCRCRFCGKLFWADTREAQQVAEVMPLLTAITSCLYMANLSGRDDFDSHNEVAVNADELATSICIAAYGLRKVMQWENGAGGMPTENSLRPSVDDTPLAR